MEATKKYIVWGERYGAEEDLSDAKLLTLEEAQAQAKKLAARERTVGRIFIMQPVMEYHPPTTTGTFSGVVL